MAPRSGSPATRNRIELEAHLACPRALLSGLRSQGRRFLAALGLERIELSIAVVGDEEIRELNRRWRRIDRSTDVLSFPLEPSDGPLLKDHLSLLGDIVISLETARRCASEEGHSVQLELARYLAHGLLHLLGHDHHHPTEARRMAAEERRLLGEAGMIELAGAVPLTRRAKGSQPQVRRERHGRAQRR